MRTRTFCKVWVVLGWISCTSAAELSLDILDVDTQKPVSARIRLRDAKGSDHTPPDAQVVPIGHRDKWFVSSGHTRIDLPQGKYDLRIERGCEYIFHRQQIDIELDTIVTVTPKRWINMRERGYVCGENHLHVTLEDLPAQLVSEGLDFGTSLQWWDGPEYDVPAAGGFVRALSFAGQHVPTSVYDYEIERSWGAVYVIGQPTPLTYKKDGRRPNLPLVRESHNAGALVCYQGGWSRESMLDALLGYVDVINVCNNNFHRHRFQPRLRYSNLLQVDGFPDYPNTPEGMMRMNTDTYYRMLNCGMKLAAGAGSAVGVKPSPVGYNRAYVRAGKKPTLPQFLEAWRAGKNFVTCGPMIFLTVNNKYKPGDTIEFGPGGGEIAAKVEALWDQPIKRVEIIINGKAVGTIHGNGKRRVEADISTTTGKGIWIAARCIADEMLLSDEELAAYKEGDRAWPTRTVFAHTSPVYISVDGKLAREPEAVAETSKMLDAFTRFADKQVSDEYRKEISEAIEEARKRLNTH